MVQWFLVGAGGALGAMGRYGISLLPLKSGFPWLTLLTNLAGAVLIGFISGLRFRQAVGEKAALFWKTGVCGGFTTFSAFSLEAWGLLEQGNYLAGSLYIAVSVVLCILGVVLGQLLSRTLVSA